MIEKIIAHAGETHESTAEAVQHATEFTVGVGAVYWLVLFFGAATLLLLLQALKTRLSTKLLTLSVFLITFSIVSYQNPGVYSAVSLSVGFGVVLFLSLAGLSARE